MAHGSKRWIRCYDGSIKKSNDRTNKDYFRDVKYWDVEYWYVVSNRRKKANNCPQCKFVRKQMVGYDGFRSHDWRNFVCFKHERMIATQDKIPWKRYNSYREQQKEYRHTVKNLMQRAKFDIDLDEAYEKIPVFKYDGWRD